MTSSQFLALKKHILTRGNRETFSAMLNNNPHYAFDGGIDAYLMPDIGQRNINCDPALSDFDGIVFRISSAERGPQYVEVRLDPVTKIVSAVRSDEAQTRAVVERVLAQLP